jgi:hypothetical protein
VKTTHPARVDPPRVDGTTSYRITIRGSLSDRFASAFDGMRVEPGRGTTALVGEVQDQAELYGLVNRLRDFGFELLRLERVGE